MRRSNTVAEVMVRSIRQQAELLGKTERSLRGLVARRMIPFRKLGSRVVFIASEIDAWLAAMPGVTLSEAEENMAVRRGGR